MLSLISPSAMRDMEKRYFAETGTPSIDLMERAATALAEAVLRRYGAGGRVFVACGPGGNGGDGYACARLLARAGCACALFPADAPKTPDCAENARRAADMGMPTLRPADAPDAPDIWLDALYGTGLSRAPEGEAAALIGRMNADRARGSAVVAVDIPSGLNGATGTAFAPCVRADCTVTFQFAKTGHFLSDGLDACGDVETADIGIPAAFHPNDMAALMAASDALRALPETRRNVHKGHNGHLLIVAGSVGMAGAAAMCALSALRSGAGLVTVACPAPILPVVQTLAPCAMAIPLPEADGAISGEAAKVLSGALAGKSAAVCGCGLSLRAAPEVVRLMLECGVPALFDADALNLIARDDSLRALLRPHHLITPHPGEAARLLGRRVTDPVADALALSALGCQVILKGAASVIPVDGVARLSASGCQGMAKGGSGDVLAGLAGALMARRGASGVEMTGAALAETAAAASELHGLAGELAQAKLGPAGMCASDIVDALPRVLAGMCAADTVDALPRVSAGMCASDIVDALPRAPMGHV